MRLIVKKLFEGLSSALREAWDVKLYYSALDKAYRKKPQGMLSLAKIYEHGSTVLSRDMAIAYAFYCLSRNQRKDVQEKISYLENQLTPTEKIKAEVVMKDFL